MWNDGEFTLPTPVAWCQQRHHFFQDTWNESNNFHMQFQWRLYFHLIVQKMIRRWLLINTSEELTTLHVHTIHPALDARKLLTRACVRRLLQVSCGEAMLSLKVVIIIRVSPKRWVCGHRLVMVFWSLFVLEMMVFVMIFFSPARDWILSVCVFVVASTEVCSCAVRKRLISKAHNKQHTQMISTPL